MTDIKENTSWQGEKFDILWETDIINVKENTLKITEYRLNIIAKQIDSYIKWIFGIWVSETDIKWIILKNIII